MTDPIDFATGQAGRMWRSMGERELPSEWRSIVTPEFALGADQWPPGMDRREFLRLMGASLALGGLAGCTRPAGRLVPYVTPPEEALPGSPEFYATAIPIEGYARGILVESHLGRPTKIEGNPDHPESGGSTDALTQAAILSLYDPDRSKAPLHRGAEQSWEAFEAEWRAFRPGLLAKKGQGLALLSEPTTSPTFLRQIGRLLAAFPEARWYQHTPLATYGVGGSQMDFDFRRARVVLFVGSDCLFRHPACLRYSRDFASRRRVTGTAPPGSRVYAVEATPTLTGAAADFRLPASPNRIRTLLDAVSGLVDGNAPAEGAALTAAEYAFATSLAHDLRSAAPEVVCVAGSEQDPDVQAWALAMNAKLGAAGGTLRLLPQVRSDNDPRSAGALDRLAAALRADEVQSLFVLGSNPVYTSAEFRGLAAELARVPFTVHVGSHVDETGALCRWHLPEAHFLEAWDDRRGYDGTTSLVQPLIQPLYEGRSVLEVLHGLHTDEHATSYDLVRQTWEAGGGEDFEVRWARWLREGKVEGTQSAALVGPSAALFPTLSRPGASVGLFLLLVPDASVLDGRWSNNAWLQELPRPLTQLVWDNAALISPSLAANLGAKTGDMLRIEDGSAAVEAAAYVLPGHGPGCVTLSLGYGRTRAGAVGNGRGFDATPIRRTALWENPNISVRRTGSTYPLVTTQHHFTMEGREPVRLLPAGRMLPDAADPSVSLYPAWKPGTNAWGMSIDLGTCIGCNACVVACQAENNTPVVGKDQVSRGREMHWIRIDRYFDGDADAPRILNQPVPCMHCENAPCEVVCPVGATVHSSEGLNEMVYNRCVGTRFCSNNCPYKVRRFNFLNYTKVEGPLKMLQNPDVTVRSRGVMEKCTYCVQRIQCAKIDAEEDGRLVRDGEIAPACAQACPARAIVFGNLKDADSEVSRLKRDPRDYGLLTELGTRPRTSYQARLRNPNPELEPS